MKRLICGHILALVMVTGTALASQCDEEIKRVDEALTENAASLPEEQLAEARRARDEAAELCAVGDEDGAEERLSVSKFILGLG